MTNTYCLTSHIVMIKVDAPLKSCVLLPKSEYLALNVGI
jgi:hypothetical protein